MMYGKKTSGIMILNAIKMEAHGQFWMCNGEAVKCE